MELFHASAQWASRPADEKFNSFEALHAATKAYAVAAREKTVPWTSLRVEARETDLSLIGSAGVPATLTHYAFGQLASRIEAPASYLRALPPTLAAQNINHGLKEKVNGEAQLLFHQNGGLILRAATSEKYARIWNYEVVARLQEAAHRFNMVPARQTFSWSGDAVPADAPAALYASDHDMFAFAMSTTADVKDPTGATLRRGVIVQNSEVGDCSLKMMRFLFRDLCANHIIWGASEVMDIRLTHMGDIRQRWSDAVLQIRKYLDGSGTLQEDMLKRTSHVLAASKEEVLDLLFGIRKLGFSRKLLEAGYDAVKPEEDGPANTVWGMAQGLTRYSQTVPYADERQVIDRQAGKLLDFVF
jgi:hypothetical protein